MLNSKRTLTKAKVWEWYGTAWTISDPQMGMVWEGNLGIWNWYGAKFYQIFNYGTCMGRKQKASYFMGNLWE